MTSEVQRGGLRVAALMAGVLAVLLGACASQPTPPTQSAKLLAAQEVVRQAVQEPAQEAAPITAACPAGVPAGARCLRGVDSAKAPYLIVMPAPWSGVLVVHAHGGPFLGEPTAARADEDIKRWAITVQLGHAWAGSVFRQGGLP